MNRITFGFFLFFLLCFLFFSFRTFCLVSSERTNSKIYTRIAVDVVIIRLLRRREQSLMPFACHLNDSSFTLIISNTFHSFGSVDALTISIRSPWFLLSLLLFFGTRFNVNEIFLLPGFLFPFVFGLNNLGRTRCTALLSMTLIKVKQVFLHIFNANSLPFFFAIYRGVFSPIRFDRHKCGDTQMYRPRRPFPCHSRVFRLRRRCRSLRIYLLF